MLQVSQSIYLQVFIAIENFLNIMNLSLHMKEDFANKLEEMLKRLEEERLKELEEIKKKINLAIKALRGFGEEMHSQGHSQGNSGYKQ